MKITKLPCVVTIAGTDPSGGAGIQADIKTISATGSYAASVITALVAQNTTGVQAIQSVSADFVQVQLHSVFSDLDVKAIKIGMLHDARIIEIVFEELKKRKQQPIIFDPVMLAKDGSVLLDLTTLDLLRNKIIGAVSLITPNLLEAEHLLGKAVVTISDMQSAAMQLGNQSATNVLLKGGHFNGENSSDVFYNLSDNTCHWFHAKRIHTPNTHGTGCSLSSAIASFLAQDFSLFEAIHAAKKYLTNAIQSGRKYSVGHGNGPIDHFYFLDNRNQDN